MVVHNHSRIGIGEWRPILMAITGLYPQHPFGACCMPLETPWSQLLSIYTFT